MPCNVLLCLIVTGKTAEDLTFKGPERPKTIPTFATLISLGLWN